MELKERNGLTFYEVSSFKFYEGVVAAFSTRHGGVSKPPYDSLNLGLHVGDEPASVLHNRELFAKALQLNPQMVVCGAQVHGSEVAEVTGFHAGRGSADAADALPGVDALVTAEAGVPLTAFFADCVPLWFYAPRQRVVGLAHAGWRGTAAKIAVKTVRFLCLRWGIEPAEILAAVGPSIGPCCYEVGSEVAGAFRTLSPEWPLFLQKLDRNWRLDLWEANRLLLVGDAGLQARNIEVAGICTACRHDLFFSYRAGGGRTGRMGAVICLV
ncbi:MAG: peptidoglycan editing factor PgeF [Bacillota bacterium]